MFVAGVAQGNLKERLVWRSALRLRGLGGRGFRRRSRLLRGVGALRRHGEKRCDHIDGRFEEGRLRAGKGPMQDENAKDEDEDERDEGGADAFEEAIKTERHQHCEKCADDRQERVFGEERLDEDPEGVPCSGKRREVDVFQCGRL